MGVSGIYWNLRVHVERGSEGQRERARGNVGFRVECGEGSPLILGSYKFRLY